MYLGIKPDAFEFIPDFSTGEIKIITLHAIENVFAVQYPKRQQEIEGFGRTYSNLNILRRVNEVYINQDKQLVFNTHQLYITRSGQLYFGSDGANTVSIKKAVRKRNQRVFEFNDGSMVTVDDCGFITLTSSNKNIAEVYFASQLEIPLGMATQYEFAGKEFFYHEELGKVKVTLTDAGSLKIQAIQIMRNYTALSLSILKGIVDGAPEQIPISLDIDKAGEMIQELEKAGCSTSMQRPAQPKQQVISAETFYQQNIATFIAHIIEHGAGA